MFEWKKKKNIFLEIVKVGSYWNIDTEKMAINRVVRDDTSPMLYRRSGKQSSINWSWSSEYVYDSYIFKCLRGGQSRTKSVSFRVVFIETLFASPRNEKQ